MTQRSLQPWKLTYRGWSTEEQSLREALTTLGNGHFAVRGAAEQVRAGGAHYPGTYLAGGYDRLESEVAGRVIENEDLVNWPNWLPLTFRCDQGRWFDIDTVSILDYELELDIRSGVRTTRVHFRDDADREFELEARRIVHLEDAHAAAVSWTLTPLNWSGALEVRSSIDGWVTNSGVERYRELASRHLEVSATGGTGEDAVYLVARTRQSHLVMAQAVRTRIWVEGDDAAVERTTSREAQWVGQILRVQARARRTVRVEKVLSLYSSRDFALSEPCLQACKHVHRLPDFPTLLERHTKAWKRLWRRADIVLGGCREGYAQSVLRLHLFHILQTTSLNTVGRDVGVPARGLHGEAYRGHIFWDELFTFPFFNLRFPELTRSLLLYRYRRLAEARHAARQEGLQGAMFPWQSGSDGREESQRLHLNPESGRWLPDNTHRQRHVNAAIAYNVWQFHQATGDRDFLSAYGAEMLLEIARFWASAATYNPRRERYEIRGVVGPDEFHTRYPGTDGPGLNNNAYTNIMAVWVLRTARAALDELGECRRAELLESLEISPADLSHWDDVSRRMYVPFCGEIICQFEGFERLEELDWDRLKREHGEISRLDRLLEAEGDDPNRYKAAKQADVLMLFYLFSAEELRELMDHMGYEFDPGWIPKNVDYYLSRTSHGSTLSRVVHAWVLARTDRRRSWHLFRDALASDIDDLQGGTTPEGIHMGAMAGTVDLVQRCYTGIEMRHGILWLSPMLPDGLEGLDFSLRYRGHRLSLHLDHERLSVKFEHGRSPSVNVGFRGAIHEIHQGQEMTFALQQEKR